MEPSSAPLDFSFIDFALLQRAVDSIRLDPFAPAQAQDSDPFAAAFAPASNARDVPRGMPMPRDYAGNWADMSPEPSDRSERFDHSNQAHVPHSPPYAPTSPKYAPSSPVYAPSSPAPIPPVARLPARSAPDTGIPSDMDMLFQSCYGAAQQLGSMSQVELECRLGVRLPQTGDRRRRVGQVRAWEPPFVAGVTKDDFVRVLSFLRTESPRLGFEERSSVTLDELADSDRDRHRRRTWTLTAMANGSTWTPSPTGWVDKKMYADKMVNEMSRRDLPASLPYDLRMAFSTERPCGIPEGQAEIDAPLYSSRAAAWRFKNRYRFVPRDGDRVCPEQLDAPKGRLNAWAIDLTQVTHVSFGQKDIIENTSTAFEIELEFVGDAGLYGGIPRWRLECYDQFLAIIQDLITPSLRAFEGSNTIVEGLACQRLMEAEENHLRARLTRLILSSNERALEHNPYVEKGRPGQPILFPGSLPQALSRRHIGECIASVDSYSVAEKTDGQRFLLVLDRPSSVLLWNRAGAMWRVDGAQWDETHSSFGQVGQHHVFPIVLDGEMARDELTLRPVFYAFDVLYSGLASSPSLVASSYGERWQELLAVNRFLRAGAQPLGREQAPIWTCPFPVLLKEFVPLRRIQDLALRLRPAYTTGLSTVDALLPLYHYDTANGIVHATDGLVLSPNAAYYNVKFPTLKYKRPTEHSVDFEICVRDFPDRFNLYAKALNGSPTCFINDRRKMHHQDLNMLKRDVELWKRGAHTRPRYIEQVVVSLCYDPQFGRWRYIGLRPEKRYANSIMVAEDTLEKVAERIQLVDLVEFFAQP